MKPKLTTTEQFERHYGVKFLKSPKERTTAENIIVLSLYDFTYYRDINYNQAHSVTRSAACIEAVLLMDGVLKLGQDFERKVTKSKFLFWESEVEETYRELMQRMGLEYLKERGVVE
jgi:hypothetical protein